MCVLFITNGVPSLNDKYMLLFVYEYGILIFVITVISCIFMPLFYLCLNDEYQFKFNNDNFKVQKGFKTTVDLLLESKACQEMNECLVYGMIEFNNIEKYVWCLIFLFFV